VSKCDHKWEFIRDWYGDPNVVNGTADCSHWRCKTCGEQTQYQPDDWVDPREIAAEERAERLRDEWRDDMRRDVYGEKP